MFYTCWKAIASEIECYDLDVQLVGEKEMSHLNEKHVGHSGSTDVISIDYGDGASRELVGEIFVCVDEALIQARQFRTSWQSELVRYIVHGVLHLLGHDDTDPGAPRNEA